MVDIKDIKRRIYKDENGISNYVDVSIEEMDWLIEQAEKVRALEKANEILERTLTTERNLSK